VWDGRTYAVGGGIKVSASLQELTTIASEATCNNIKITSEPSVRSGDIPLYVTDCTKVRDDFGWTPQRMINDIAVDVERWITENEEVLQPIFC
jgi:CDP-paratose 2-epimerase